MITEPSSPARSYVGLLRERLARREDSEHVQALIRVGFGLFISIYLYSTIGPRLDIHVVCIGFEILSLAIVVAILIRPQRSAWRRGFGAVLDLGTTTYLMWTNGEVGAPPIRDLSLGDVRQRVPLWRALVVWVTCNEFGGFWGGCSV